MLTRCLSAEVTIEVVQLMLCVLVLSAVDQSYGMQTNGWARDVRVRLRLPARMLLCMSTCDSIRSLTRLFYLPGMCHRDVLHQLHQ